MKGTIIAERQDNPTRNRDINPCTRDEFIAHIEGLKKAIFDVLWCGYKIEGCYYLDGSIDITISPESKFLPPLRFRFVPVGVPYKIVRKMRFVQGGVVYKTDEALSSANIDSLIEKFRKGRRLNRNSK